MVVEKLGNQITEMENYILNLVNEYSIKELNEKYGYNPEDHLTLLHEYEDTEEKIPNNFLARLKNREIVKKESELEKKLEPYNILVLTYKEFGELPEEDEKEPVGLTQHAKEFLGGCYQTVKVLPRAIKENPKKAGIVAGAIIVTPLFLNAAGLVYSAQSADSKITNEDNAQNSKLPNLLNIIGVAKAKPVKDLLDNPATEFDKKYSNVFEDDYNDLMDKVGSIPNIDKVDDTMFFFYEGELEFINHHSFKIITESDKPIYPDEITEQMYNNAKDEPGLLFYGQTNEIGENRYTTYSPVRVSPTDFAVWLGAASYKKVVKPYLVYVDTDGDGKPEELAALYNYPYADWVAADEFEPQLEGHFVRVPGGYIINPFEIPKEDMGPIHKLVYIENPDKISVMMHEEEVIDQWGKKKGNIILPDKIPWKEAVGKTPAELGLDKYDKKILGGDSKEVYSDTEKVDSTNPNVEDDLPVESEKQGGVPFAGAAGALAIAYLSRKKLKHKA